jgi:phage-related protein
MPWAIEFYGSDEEGCPVQEFLDGLDKPRRAKLVAAIKLLEEQGPALPFPYSSQVRGKVRELRAHYGSEHFRLLYFGAPNRAFVLLHALEKRAEKLPGRDIKLAEKRMGKYLERLEDD